MSEAALGPAKEVGAYWGETEYCAGGAAVLTGELMPVVKPGLAVCPNKGALRREQRLTPTESREGANLIE
jgi:hypothetical protein